MEISGFEQSEKIAESGFASYWKAYQTSLDRHVTLVVLRPDAVADEKARRAFLRDIRIMAGLKHPALFQIYDVMELDATLVVVVEHLAGLTLRQYVRQRGQVKGEKALTIVRWVAEGLSHVYEKTGLLHLALTPDQVWINGEGEVKILGFGFSDIFERIGYSAADIPFLSPEQVQHRSPYDFPSDMYSLGAILYYMLAGRVPFEGNSSEEIVGLIVSGQLPAPSGPGVTMAIQQVLVRMLMKEPGNRYPGWLPAMQEMDKILDGAKFLPGAKKSTFSTILMPPVSRSTAARATAAPTRAPEHPPVSSASVFMVLTVIAAVLGFWGWVGFTLWRMPAPVPAPTYLSPGPSGATVETRREMSADESPAARVRVVRHPGGAGETNGIESLEPDASPSEPGERSAAVQGSTGDAEAQPPPAAAPAFETLADEVVRQLVAGAPAKALAAVDALAKAKPGDVSDLQLSEMRSLVVRGCNPGALALAALKRQVGQKVKLPVNGRMADVVVSRVDVQTAVVIESVQSENTPVKKYYTLDPAKVGLGDQIRLLALGTGPEFAVARILVYLKGNSRERAAAVAAEAGLLATAFQRFLSGPAP